jgi:dihydroorotate dehydrogenase
LTVRGEALSQNILGSVFPNPVGLAAGFDKNAEQLGAWGSLGFGFCEIGSVTARPSAGNPVPRAFRLPDDRALVNRMGLNNDGAEAVAARLEALPKNSRAIPIGVNIAKTHDPGIVEDEAIEDFVRSVSLLAPHADYITLNISCPNTAEGKTFEEPEALDALLERVMFFKETLALPPVLVKVSAPGVGAGGLMEFGALNELVDIALSRGIAGFVATNTARDRVNLVTDPSHLAAIGRGGLSGRPLAERALATLRRIYVRTGGDVPVIGVGGIDSPEEAYARIRAGASLVQIYTGLVYEGPGLVRRINRRLLRLLERDGFDNVSQAVGADVEAS